MLGKTKILMRDEVVHMLDARRQAAMGDVAITIQSVFRAFETRSWYTAVRQVPSKYHRSLFNSDSGVLYQAQTLSQIPDRVNLRLLTTVDGAGRSALDLSGWPHLKELPTTKPKMAKEAFLWHNDLEEAGQSEEEEESVALWYWVERRGTAVLYTPQAGSALTPFKRRV